MSSTKTRETWTSWPNSGWTMERRKKDVKEDVFSITELNAKFEHKMKEKIATSAKENTMKIDAIQEELRASNAKNNAILAMMNKLPGSM